VRAVPTAIRPFSTHSHSGEPPCRHNEDVGIIVDTGTAVVGLVGQPDAADEFGESLTNVCVLLAGARDGEE
jgi:hypothetical protein